MSVGEGVKGIIPWNIFKVILADFQSILSQKMLDFCRKTCNCKQDETE